MSRYRFDLATTDDDAALRRFLRRSVMPGSVELGFRREPDYFAPGGTFGPFHQTVVCRDRAADDVVGTGCRSVRTVHVDGAPTPIGYLSMLRSAPHVRNGLLLARGYRFLRQLHQDRRAPCYLTTIAEGNDVALDVLTSGRASLPRYRPAGRYRTFAIATSRRRRASFSPGRGSVGPPPDLDAAVAFLATHGKSRQFFPAYSRSDFDGPNAPLTGLSPDDLVVYADGSGRVRGVMGLWDQRSFRQTIVAGYAPPLGRLRPLYNLAAPIHRRPRLPAPGEQLHYGYAATTAVEDDDPDTFDALLDAVLAEARSRGLPIVLFGCDDRDPLRPLAERRSFLTYTTRVFLVSWDADRGAGEPAHDPSLPIYLELGCL